MVLHINMSDSVETGRIVFTPGVQKDVELKDRMSALLRHKQGDMGDGQIEEGEGGRIHSIYADRKGTKFWIITEADHSLTTVMLPSEY